MLKLVSSGVLSAAILLLANGCATIGKNAVVVDHKDASLVSKIKGRTPSEVQALLGDAVMKGFDATNPGSPELRTYSLVYVEKNQAPIYDWQLKMRVNNNKKENSNTGIKCIAINFPQETGYKFEDGGAAIYDNYDCIQFRNLAGAPPK